MSRKSKPNELPVASWNLRTTGPLSEAEVFKQLAPKRPRIASGKLPDTRATIDKDPCPDCGAVVEWATTTRKGADGKSTKYIYARCRGGEQHRFTATAAVISSERPTPEDRPKAVHEAPPVHHHKPMMDSLPAPRPSAGATLMGNWIDRQIDNLGSQMDKLKLIQTLAKEVTGRSGGPLASPTLPVPPNGDPTPPHHSH